MLAGKGGCFRIPRRLHQRANACKYAQDVSSRGWLREVVPRGFQDKLNLSVEWLRFETYLRNRSVSGSNYRLALPGDRKHHSAIARMGNHDRRVAWKK